MANTGTVASLSCAPWSAASHAAHTAQAVHTGGVADVYLAVFKPSASLAAFPSTALIADRLRLGFAEFTQIRGDECGPQV